MAEIRNYSQSGVQDFSLEDISIQIIIFLWSPLVLRNVATLHSINKSLLIWLYRGMRLSIMGVHILFVKVTSRDFPHHHLTRDEDQSLYKTGRSGASVGLGKKFWNWSAVFMLNSLLLCIFSSLLWRFWVPERKVLVQRKAKWLPDNVLVPKHIPGFCNSAWAVRFFLPMHFHGSTPKAVNISPSFVCLFVFAWILFKVYFHLLISTCIDQLPPPEIKK